MRLLYLHCDFIKYEATRKALKNIEEIMPDQPLSDKEEDCLVVLLSVENSDNDKTIDLLKKDIFEISRKLSTKKIVIYPYAHLSKNLAKPRKAAEILKKICAELSGFSLKVAPFGYYKKFQISVKGHPLSELSREIVAETKEETDIKKLLSEIKGYKLDTSKLKDNDHRIIGKKMDLWSFNVVAPGMVFWHDKGLFIKNKLIEFMRNLQKTKGYLEVSTPQIMDKKLWKISGHWEKYSKNNFITKYEGRDFLIKPMNCPGGMLIYKSSQRFLRDLPMRLSEFGIVHRAELSGVLAGLFRVIQFTQDDAHIFCTEEQLKDEINGVIDMVKNVFETFKLPISHIELSTKPKDRIGTDSQWKFSEEVLESVLKTRKIKFKINKGEGAFYGPKIDFHIKDSLSRTWQLATIQLDMSLPQRFDLTYIDGERKKRPIVIHRAIFGSIERFIAILTEHLNGKFPLWLSPNQIMVMNVSEKAKKYAQRIFNELRGLGFNTEIDDREETISKKVREAQIKRFNYLVTIGERELAENKMAVKKRDEKKISLMTLDNFVKLIKKEISGS